MAGDRVQFVQAIMVLGVLLLLLGAAIMYRYGRRTRERETQLATERVLLSAAYAELDAGKRRAEAESFPLHSILSGMSDGVMMLDSEFRLLQWNANFPAFSGTPPELLKVGLPMEEIIRAQARRGEFGALEPDACEAEVQRRIRLVRRLRNTDVTERLRPDGRVLETRRRALPDGGAVTLYTDITARHRAEAAQREVLRLSEVAIEQKAQFVAMVSHEIRVPLNAVTGSLALLDQSALSPQQRVHVDTAREAGDTLLDLIHDILDLSKIDAGRLQLRPAEFSLRPMLQGVCDMFVVQARARGIELGLRIGPDVPVLLDADGGRLRQVLMNFVSNAIKFSRPGTVTLLAELAEPKPAEAGPAFAGLPAPHRLRLTVCDQGPRIPAAQANLLYQPFARLDYATDAGIPGTGLGLTICKQLVRLMGGELGLGPAMCDDGQDDGNAFWLELGLDAGGMTAQPPATGEVFAMPAASSSPRAAPVAFDPNVLPPRPKRRAGVLLVEDVATNRVLTSALLRREGHRVDAVQSGEAAVAAVASQPFDVVFMDLNMPGIDGCEATRRIRALPGPERQVPIVALTATERLSVLARCRDAGMNDVLGKPTRPRELFAMLDRMVRPWPPTLLAAPPVDTEAPQRHGVAPQDSTAIAPDVAPIGPGPAEPGVADPGLADPGLADPRLADPRLADPRLADPRLADPDHGLLDAERLLDLQRGLPAGLFASLVEQCLDDIAARMTRLHQGLVDHEAVAVVGTAHALAGMSGSYGLAALERRMRLIMHAADVGDIETASAAAQGMASELERSARRVRALLQAQAA